MEQRNLILAIVLSVVILLGFNFLVETPRNERAQQAADAAKTTKIVPGATELTTVGTGVAVGVGVGLGVGVGVGVAVVCPVVGVGVVAVAIPPTRSNEKVSRSATSLTVSSWSVVSVYHRATPAAAGLSTTS